jgi:hypothetical protein
MRYRRARRNEGRFGSLDFKPIPNIPDSKWVRLDFKNGYRFAIAGAPTFPQQGDGSTTWAVQITGEPGEERKLGRVPTEEVEALIAEYEAKPPTDDYLYKTDYAAYQARLKARRDEAEAKRQAEEDAYFAKLTKLKKNAKFRNWFGKSKVVDARGRPLKVYHGSEKAGFTSFDTYNQKKPGFFFTDDWGMAASYTPRHTLVELPYLRTLKEALAFAGDGSPLEIEKDGREYTVFWDGSRVATYGPGETKDMLADINSQTSTNPGVYAVYLRMEDPMVIDAKGQNWDAIEIEDDEGNVETYETNDFARMAADADHDGVIIHNVSDYGSHGNGLGGTVYVVFEPNQIKSADWNIGTYSRDEDDLRLNPRRPRPARRIRRSRR